MKKFICIPDDLIITLYSVAFRVEVGKEQEFKPSQFAKFIEIIFYFKNDDTGEEFFTKPLTYSLN